ncbi:unnamed protein product, partial [Discosporangium mesarthrocarpum]
GWQPVSTAAGGGPILLGVGTDRAEDGGTGSPEARVPGRPQSPAPGRPEERAAILAQEVEGLRVELDRALKCVACLSRDRDTLLLPCKHLVLCSGCCRKIFQQSMAAAEVAEATAVTTTTTTTTTTTVTTTAAPPPPLPPTNSAGAAQSPSP